MTIRRDACPFCAREYAPHVAGCFAFDELPEDPAVRERQEALTGVALALRARVAQLSQPIFDVDDETFERLLKLLGVTDERELEKFKKLAARTYTWEYAERAPHTLFVNMPAEKEETP